MQLILEVWQYVSSHIGPSGIFSIYSILCLQGKVDSVEVFVFCDLNENISIWALCDW